MVVASFISPTSISQKVLHDGVRQDALRGADLGEAAVLDNRAALFGVLPGLPRWPISHRTWRGTRPQIRAFNIGIGDKAMASNVRIFFAGVGTTFIILGVGLWRRADDGQVSS